jgi:L-fucose isomerase-like protein
MAKIGLVGVCSPFESGGQRYDELMSAFSKSLATKGVEVEIGNRSVWNVTDAISVIDQFKEADIDALAMVIVTWITDSLAYTFTKELPVPSVFWAVPYPETFSIGCIQNYGSILKTQGIHFEYVYGLDEPSVIEKVKKVALAGEIVKKVKSMRICLAGPRQTWRVASSQDMSKEEWDFSLKLGPTILHEELDVVTEAAKKISDEDAKKTLEALKPHTGTVKASEKCMLWMAKVYMATKETIQELGLQGFAAECYPYYSGLMNQTASWLADEGILVDTEGDIAHTVTQYILNLAAGGGACALGEIGAYNDAENYMTVCHEGSSASSLAESLDRVVTNPSGDMGAFIGTPLKAMDKVTFCDMQGVDGEYQILVARGSTLPVSPEEWVDGGEKLVVKLRADEKKPGEVIDRMIGCGLHHHVIIKEGDYVELVSLVCKYLGIKVVTL